MAVDEALFSSSGGPCLRLYSWADPTLSLGYFQKPADIEVPPGWNVVRRVTGGGAIAHDHEITYSLTGPDSADLLSDKLELYERVHKAWMKALKSFGVATRFRKGLREGRGGSPWCFTKGDPLDLVLSDGRKILGSAQRRSQGRVLLHGSLPLRGQPLMGGTGLEEILGRSLSWGEVTDTLLPTFLSELGMLPRPSELSPEEWKSVEALENAS
ncbi:MAG: biotin/lipoate A/B protein ligase family protein [Planctomycetota bacterium]